jgi:microcystin-dependent protein
MAYQEDFTTALEVAFQAEGLTLAVVSPTVFMLQVPNADAPTTDGVQGTNITGQLITFQTRRVLEITVGAGITAGDQATVTFNNVQYAVTANANAPLATVVRGATVQQTPNAGLGTDRRLVVYEANNADPDKGRLIALPPDQASGVPLPTFRVTNALPITGSVIGDAVYVTATRQGYVWDGVSWRDITASPIRGFPNDAALQANTTEPVGSYAIATDSGNLYIRTPSGWRRIGISEFSTYNDLQSYNAPLGSQAMANDIDVLFLRVSEGGVAQWKPISVMAKDEATILAGQNIAGLQAVATDTGRTYVNDGTKWIEQPIRHYDTQADLQTATPPNNTLAWANDTGNVFTYVASRGWIGLNTGIDDPIPVGAMMDFPTRAIPNGWLECNGQAIPADGKYDELRTLLGTTNVPDLRGYFSRAIKDGQTPLTKTAWTTGKSKTDLTGTTNTAGVHTHGLWSRRMNAYSGAGYSPAAQTVGEGISAGGVTNVSGRWMDSDGDHSHTVTINGGGDAETAPDHYTSVRCIKAFHITATVPGPDRMLTAFVAPKTGETLVYDGATGSWGNQTVGGIVGAIQQSVLTETQFAVAAGHDAANWVLADGRSVAGSKYAQITGNANVPDLRGAFIRAAGQNANSQSNWNGGTVGSWHNDTTRAPRNTALTGTTNSTGAHRHLDGNFTIRATNRYGNIVEGGTSLILSNTGATFGPREQSYTSTDGNHTHAVTINGGGDAETAPVHFSLNVFIRIN